MHMVKEDMMRGIIRGLIRRYCMMRGIMRGKVQMVNEDMMRGITRGLIKGTG